jgi:hypothetical protein
MATQIILGAEFNEYTTRDTKEERQFGRIFVMDAEPVTTDEQFFGFNPEAFPVEQSAYKDVRRSIIDRGELPGLYEVEYSRRQVRTDNGPAYVLRVRSVKFISSVALVDEGVAAVAS